MRGRHQRFATTVMQGGNKSARSSI
jgi:hypothetical protein